MWDSYLAHDDRKKRSVTISSQILLLPLTAGDVWKNTEGLWGLRYLPFILFLVNTVLYKETEEYILALIFTLCLNSQ